MKWNDKVHSCQAWTNVAFVGWLARYLLKERVYDLNYYLVHGLRL
jgi:hypothetical protein